MSSTGSVQDRLEKSHERDIQKERGSYIVLYQFKSVEALADLMRQNTDSFLGLFLSKCQRQWTCSPMASVKFSRLVQTQYCSDKFCCRVPIHARFSILYHTQYFVILFLLFKWILLFLATNSARDCQSCKMTGLLLRPVFATVC